MAVDMDAPEAVTSNVRLVDMYLYGQFDVRAVRQAGATVGVWTSFHLARCLFECSSVSHRHV